MKHPIATLLAAALAAAVPAAHAETAEAVPTAAKTLGVGALLGGLLGGPAGALIGGAGGAWLGQRDTDQRLAEQALAERLGQRNLELARLRDDFRRAQRQAESHLRNVQLERRHAAAAGLQNALWLNVYFPTGEFRVKEPMIPRLERLAELLAAYPELFVSLEAHADARGGRPYNQRLSEARAHAVRLHLVRAGLDPRRVRIRAYGEEQARAAGGEERLLERRVTLRLSLDAEA